MTSPFAPEDPLAWRRLLDSMFEAVVVADVEGVIRYWNAAAESLFGYSSHEALGKPLDLIIPARFKAAHDAGFAKAVQSGSLRVGGRVMRTRAQPKDERKLYVDFSFGLLRDAAGTVNGVFAVARDATEAQLNAAPRPGA
jgi:PAS domain S-box-containing protein